MIRLVALIISITLQIVAAVLAIRLVRVTKYRASWILISIGFILMALKMIIKLIQFINDDFSFYLRPADDWLGVVIAFLFTAGVFLIGEMFYTLSRAEREHRRSERRLMRAIIQTEERERRRFAKDLHDGLGPLLSTARMTLSALLQHERDDHSKQVLESASNVINEAVESIKEISNNLSPHVLTNFGLASAIKNFVFKVSQSKSINISFDTVLTDADRFDSNIETVMYRATCEMINNTIKHANATEVNISLEKIQRTIVIKYDDNGKGFDSEKTVMEPNSGMGLSNIASRMNSINGMFVYNSAPGDGFHAVIKVKI
ncbi:MAG: sensor histidine kinase [Salinivirgaceae bacterium]|nr:sensor histidine kinase [Salinivirgaceae bacterium]MBR6081859.1 sensor histidine kinase [Salinivirgaceae bacterium]